MSQKQTAMIAEAHKLAALRKTLSMPTYGIFGQMPDGGYAPEEQFVEPPPTILLVKVEDRETPEDSPSVPAHDDFINVGKTMDLLKRAPSLDAGIKRMIAIEQPGISDEAINARLMNLPGVQAEFNKAVRKAIGEL